MLEAIAHPAAPAVQTLQMRIGIATGLEGARRRSSTAGARPWL